MIFTEMVTTVQNRFGLHSDEAEARIGTEINSRYQRVVTEVGLNVFQRVLGVSADTVGGDASVTFTGIEKIERLYDDRSGVIKVLDEVSFDSLRKENPEAGDEPTKYAIQRMGPGSVTVRLNATPQTVFALKADGLDTTDTLSGSQQPQLTTNFHYILVEGASADELRLQEKDKLASTAEAIYERGISKLKLLVAQSTSKSVRQGEGVAAGAGIAGGGGGGANSGGQVYTQTGLITFDRDPLAPFAVTSGSAVVTNLDADMLDGQHGSHYLDRANHTGVMAHTALSPIATDRLLGRDTAASGAAEEISVGGGLEFTGSAGIQTSAFTGDVTKAAGGTALTIPNDTVTFAKMQNLTTDRLVGRDTASSGDPEEISVGGGLEFTGSGGIQRSAFAGGDVTGSAGSAVLSIPNDTVTYAKMQNVSAAARLLGRGGAAGAGDPQELTIGAGLSLSATELIALITQSIRQIVSASASGNFTTTSGTLVDVTNATISITTGASATVLVMATVPAKISGGVQALFDWKVDGTDTGAVRGVITSADHTTVTLFLLQTGLSAASHTFQLRTRSSDGASTVTISMTSVMAGSLVAAEFR